MIRTSEGETIRAKGRALIDRQ
ncbi:hypothetical protein TSAR_011997 [Trichomalopsis sarcophagae]|uniref:Uncharacterized protein n=1 Tax=Trichomalopsis sarcophagae TaxID=543379 RepID=A0A232EUX2_9HYME|nr:hypothetical protein TSAR_011997 [Trichomalopsis sarcophagae]